MFDYRAIVSLLLIVSVGGCATHKPMPEAAYGEQSHSLFGDIPDGLKASQVDVLYATDRAPDQTAESLQYGHDRSLSLAFGVARVDLGGDLSWDELVAWTLAQQPAPDTIEPSIESITEITRLPPSPYKFVRDARGKVMVEPSISAERAKVQEIIRETIRSRLDLTDRKQVYIHIHGIKEPFPDPLIQMAISYHLYGRQGVPIVYSWPAGEPGLLRGYTRDRESGEFTIFHLKEFLRTIIAMDEIEQINITAHSRGTDVLTTALRELVIEARASGADAREALKIGQVIMLAADLDVQVVGQRATAEALSFAVERLTVYVNERDAAIAVSAGLFGSEERVGGVELEDTGSTAAKRLDQDGNVDVIFYQGKEGGFLGHSYYQAPVVLADIFLLLDGRPPGASYGRPLKPLAPSIWQIDDGYLQ